MQKVAGTTNERRLKLVRSTTLDADISCVGHQFRISHTAQEVVNKY